MPSIVPQSMSKRSMHIPECRTFPCAFDCPSHKVYCNVLPTVRPRGPHGVRLIPIPHIVQVLERGCPTTHNRAVNLLEVVAPGCPHSSQSCSESSGSGGLTVWCACGWNVVDDFRLHNLKNSTNESLLVRDTIFLAEIRIAKAS